jgi:hypothetical protein
LAVSATEAAGPVRDAASETRPAEDDVEAAIISWLRLNGWDVTKTSLKARAKGATKGTPDLYVRRGQERIWIEVKKPDGVTSEAQVRWHEAERRAGGRVIVAYGTEDVAELARARAA